jgi:archaellum biogenesis ATPase FlaH
LAFDFLVIDNLTIASTPDFLKQKLEYLIRHRYNQYKPTIITLTCPSGSFEQKINSPLNSFLTEACILLNHTTIADNRRTKKAK